MEQTKNVSQEAILTEYEEEMAYLMPTLTWDEYHERYGQDEEPKHLNVFPPCPRCGLPFGQWRGYRKTEKGETRHRRKCTRCGRWFQQNCGGDEE